MSSTRVSSKILGEFYNVAGFHVMSWVETLDLTKWPDEATDAERGADREFRSPHRRREDVPRRVFGEDVSTLQALVTRTGLSELDAEVVCRLLLDCSSDGVLDESVYETWSRGSCFPRACLMTTSDRHEQLLSSLFDAFNRDGRGRSTPPSSRAASACSARARRAPSSRPRGSCSTTTAMASSRAVALWRYLRVVSHHSDGRVRGGDRRRAEHGACAADEGAIWLSTHIFTQAATNTIAFNFFADWYGVGAGGEVMARAQQRES